MTARADEGSEAPCLAPLLEASTIDDQLLAQLVRNPDAAVITDADGTIVFWNSATSRRFGWIREGRSARGST